jgi:hypothetical protein
VLSGITLVAHIVDVVLVGGERHHEGDAQPRVDGRRGSRCLKAKVDLLNSLSGVWWLDGNPLPGVAVSIADSIHT